MDEERDSPDHLSDAGSQSQNSDMYSVENYQEDHVFSETDELLTELNPPIEITSSEGEEANEFLSGREDSDIDEIYNEEYDESNQPDELTELQFGMNTPSARSPNFSNPQYSIDILNQDHSEKLQEGKDAFNITEFVYIAPIEANLTPAHYSGESSDIDGDLIEFSEVLQVQSRASPKINPLTGNPFQLETLAFVSDSGAIFSPLASYASEQPSSPVKASIDMKTRTPSPSRSETQTTPIAKGEILPLQKGESSIRSDAIESTVSQSPPLVENRYISPSPIYTEKNTRLFRSEEIAKMVSSGPPTLFAPASLLEQKEVEKPIQSDFTQDLHEASALYSATRSPSPKQAIVECENLPFSSVLKKESYAMDDQASSPIKSAEMEKTEMTTTDDPCLNISSPMQDNLETVTKFLDRSPVNSKEIDQKKSISTHGADTIGQAFSYAHKITSPSSFLVQPNHPEKILLAQIVPLPKPKAKENHARIEENFDMDVDISPLAKNVLSDIPEVSHISRLNAALGPSKIRTEVEPAGLTACTSCTSDTESKAQNQKQHHILETQAKHIEMLKKEIQSKDESIKLFESSMNISQKSILDFENDKRNISTLLMKKQDEISRISDDYKFALGQIASLKTDLRNSDQKLTGIETTEMENRSNYASSIHELSHTKKSLEWCNEELQRKNDQFAEYRREKALNLEQLQSECERISQDKLSSEARGIAAQSRVEDLDRKLQLMLEKSRETDNNHLFAQHKFMAEMDQQKKLCDLYKNKCAELTGQTNELQTLVRDMDIQITTLVFEHDSSSKKITADYNELRKYSESQTVEINRLSSELEAVNKNIDIAGASEVIGVLSQTAASASMAQKSGKSFTQVYSEFSKLQHDYAREKADNERLSKCLNDIVGEIEERGPEIQQTRTDLDLMGKHNEQLRTDLLIAVKTRNEANTFASNTKVEYDALKREACLLEKDVKDMARQTQFCLRQIEMLTSDRGGLPASEKELLIKVNAKLSGSSSDESPAEKLISERLVVFRNIEELQSQNQALRRSLRSLSAKMENQEDETNKEMEAKHVADMNEASQLIQGLNEQLKLQNLKIETFVRERDQWRGIAETRGLAHGDLKLRSNDSPPLPTPGMEYENEYDNYKKECGQDTHTLKKDLNKANHEKTELSIQVAKLNNQTNYLNERHELLTSNFNALSKESNMIRERISAMSPLAAKQDAKIEELSSTLMSLRETNEHLRSENQNIKIEYEVSKKSETRAINDSQELLRERNNANERLRDFQRHFEEKERNHELQCNKIEERLEESSRELQVSRRQLSDLIDDHRSLSARREAELKEFQMKSERFNTDVQKSKNELDSYLLTESTLKLKVQELTSQVKDFEDKLNVYKGRDINLRLLASDTPNDPMRNLQLALSQAKIELETSSAQLNLQHEQVEQYKAISQANEERLMEMNSTYDIYQAEMEQKVLNISQRLQKIEAENSDLKDKLAQSENESIGLIENAAQHQAELHSIRNEFEAAITTCKTNEETANAIANQAKRDLILQAKLAEDSQCNYEREILGHSKALQVSTSLRSLLAESDEKIKLADAAARSASFALETKTASFIEIQTRLTLQSSELEKRVQDLVAQNELVHSQFELISASQKSNLNPYSDTEVLDSAAASTKFNDLTEVIKYLRREKDIVETRLQLALHESNRTQMQVSQLQKSLDESRAVLEEERLRENKLSGTEQKHKELMERIEQANLLRESNVTLRSQLTHTQSKLAVVEKKLVEQELKARPMTEQISDLSAEVDARKIECIALTEDNERWKGRTQQILQRYERIDPQEYAQLVENVQKLTEARSILELELKNVQTVHIAEMELKDKSTSKINEVAKKYRTLSEARLGLISERDDIITKKNAELETFKDSASNSAELTKVKVEYTKLVAIKDLEKTKFRELVARSKAKSADLETQLDLIRNELAAANSLKADKDRIIALRESEVRKMQLESQTKVSQLQAQIRPTRINRTPAVSLESSELEALVIPAEIPKQIDIIHSLGPVDKNESAANEPPATTPGTKRLREGSESIKENTVSVVENMPATKRSRTEDEDIVEVRFSDDNSSENNYTVEEKAALYDDGLPTDMELEFLEFLEGEPDEVPSAAPRYEYPKNFKYRSPPETVDVTKSNLFASQFIEPDVPKVFSPIMAPTVLSPIMAPKVFSPIMAPSKPEITESVFAPKVAEKSMNVKKETLQIVEPIKTISLIVPEPVAFAPIKIVPIVFAPKPVLISAETTIPAPASSRQSKNDLLKSKLANLKAGKPANTGSNLPAPIARQRKLIRTPAAMPDRLSSSEGAPALNGKLLAATGINRTREEGQVQITGTSKSAFVIAGASATVDKSKPKE